MSDTKQNTGGSKKAAASTKAARAGKTPREARASNKTTTAKPPRATKAATVLALLRSKHGASIDEMTRATGWQVHSVRGFLSGTVKKRMGLTLGSEVDNSGTRRYRIAGGADAGNNRVGNLTSSD
ncbi:MAG: DUF3489 domain-containing protein [Nitratireductor sp.]